jgi:dihydropteroate synthase
MQKPLIKLFDRYDEAYRYLLRYIEVHEKLVPFLAEKSNAFCLLVYDFPKRELKNLNLAAEKSYVKVAFPTMLELAPEYLKVLLIGNEYDFKNLAKELKNFKNLKGLAISIIETIHRYKKESFRITTNRRVLPLGLKTAVMGVLNVTPDSFSDGGEAFSLKKAVEKGLKMALEGADIIDIGGESTRPGAEPVDAEEELKRVLPVVKELRRELDRNKLERVFISVDTYKSEVANAVLQEGADIINDISGGTFDEEILKVVVKHRAPYVINHIKGTPRTWKEMRIIYTDVVKEIVDFWNQQMERLMELGYHSKDQIILDPGIGFGKLPEHNIEILKRFGEFKVAGQPLMVGVSRKSFIGYIYEQLLNKKTEPKERLFGSLGAIAEPVLKGAHIVRVHDVKETREFLAVLDTIKTYDPYYFG